MKEEEVKALISLLDDPDEEIFSLISQSLLKQGPEIIPELEKAWEYSLDSNLQLRLEKIIQEIQFSHVKNNLREWTNSGGDNLLEGAYYVAKYQYPDLRFDDITEKINKLKRDIWLELNNNLTALEKVRIINHVLFETHKFTSNSTSFYSPQNSFINNVLDRKKGNQITLSILYLSVVQQLELPIFGVNLPKNFILAYVDAKSYMEASKLLKDLKNVLFYINPYNKGSVLGNREIEYYLKQQKIDPRDTYFLPCSNIEIIQRLLQNLIYSYEKFGPPEKINLVQELVKIVSQTEI
ncbi:MAG: transglutaminase-like domain-containing protein [Bacteroidota bacterium]|nr:transglutaminase-like domain-containing protein [Bacteroidota bacterium]MDP4227319.1 transglutaminase-like domain-containing protein [Bacteroidota bacterium]MDP4275131.1 transglutaminase-like domain-containing protein [Bacteroidota bacterium]